MVDDYLQQLVEEGDLDSHGRITLDPAKARQKLADSRFLHAAEALLALISAALLANAQSVRVQRQARSWEILSDGQPPDPQQLRDLLQDMFSNKQASGLRELALAFNSLYPKHCVSLRIELESGWAGWFEQGEWRVQALPNVPPAPFRQRIVVQQSASWSQLWHWLRQRYHGLDDMKILRVRTRWSPAPVYFQHKGQWKSSYQLDPPRVPPETVAVLYVESKYSALRLPEYSDQQNLFSWQRSTRAQSSLRCALLPGNPRDSSLLLVYRGLTLAQHRLPSQVFRFEGILNTDSLDLDASRQHIVQNKRLRQRGETVRQWVIEGTAAWLNQLDPENLPPILRQRLLEALTQLNGSNAHKPLLEALGRFQLIPLSENHKWISLNELRTSLESFQAIHHAKGRAPAYLHNRPLLHSDKCDHRHLRRLLKVAVVDAEPWVNHWLDGGGPLTQADYQSASYERFHLRGSDWEAGVHLPQAFDYGNRLVMRYQGQPFMAHDRPLFEHFPCNFQVFLDGTYAGSLPNAQDRVQDELRQKLAEKVEEWLRQMQRYAQEGYLNKVHPEYYCSLLCLWMSPKPTHRRQPPEAMLEYPILQSTVNGDRVMDLAELLRKPGQLGQHFRPQHPAFTLVAWLEDPSCGGRRKN